MVSLRKKNRVDHAEEGAGKENTQGSFFSRLGRFFARRPGTASKQCRRCGTQNPKEVFYCKECGLKYPGDEARMNGDAGALRGGPADQQGSIMHQKKTLLDKGNALYKSGNYKEALALYDSVLALDREYAKAWNNRSLALSKLGREQEASESRKRFLALQSPGQDPAPSAPRPK